MDKKYLTVIFGIIVIVIANRWGSAFSIRPKILTWQHEEEMKSAIQYYYETLGSTKGRSDPEVIATYASGEYLDYLLKVRCVNCAGIQVATTVKIVDLVVLDYSPNSSKVATRIEYGWQNTSPITGKVLGACHAQAFSAIYLLNRQNASWKVSGGEETNANRIDDSEELRAKYCANG